MMLDLICSLSASVARKRQRRAYARWIQDSGDTTRRLAYDLNAGSVVLDAGGFHGDFADDIMRLYGCDVHVFEPVRHYIEGMRQRFQSLPRIRIYPFGLGGKSGTVRLALSEDRSSHVGGDEGQQYEECEIRSFGEWIAEAGITDVALLKINIEGAEFELLEHMIEGGFLSRVRDFQVQFHLFAPGAVKRRQKIRAALSATHELTYDYFFIWENWRRKAIA